MRGRTSALTFLIAAAFALAAVTPSSACKNDASCARQTAASAVQATFSVDNVTCKNCVAKIDKAMKRLDGVQTYQYNRAKNALYVAFVPTRVSTRTIGATVAEAGFPATLLAVTNYSGAFCDPSACSTGGAACGPGGKSAGACPYAGKAKARTTKSSTL